ncbi:uncharacterized protein LOC129002032 isoform X1 [Macrosteles quadrilineatus]|uniref:uncharacterized protein LOC129002032 isoform X1 n=2 Tax=Macrosteles quadrilineatus TaxID=74068 RepID=UPI0023E2713F|nr:uncharacterized protein LOC129002032 isoform X1 [Macrosteles quadrilineatus]
MSFMQCFKDNILPQMIQSGVFGVDPTVSSVKDCSEDREEFMSNVKFVDVELKVGQASEKIPLFCKFEDNDTKEVKREKFQTDLQFSNEVFVYKEFIPLFPKSVTNIFPKFYFGAATPGISSDPGFIVFENLHPKGFEETHEKVFLDYDHCSLAFSKLGEFHGSSIQMKAKNPLEFGIKINQLRETRWLNKHKELQIYFYKHTTKRGVVPLLKKGEHVDLLNSSLDHLSNVHDVIKEILEVNKHSVLCHGDFCRNNMVFKYETSGHKPVDVKFYDLGTARYASPIIDISFFLFLNTTADLRRRYFKSDFLQTYLDSVRKYAGTEAPTMEQLWEEFQKKAVYGYLLASFFLPIMWHGHHDPPTDDLEEMTKQNLRKGGEEVTEMLSDIVKDLITWGCLEGFKSS